MRTKSLAAKTLALAALVPLAAPAARAADIRNVQPDGLGVRAEVVLSHAEVEALTVGGVVPLPHVGGVLGKALSEVQKALQKGAPQLSRADARNTGVVAHVWAGVKPGIPPKVAVNIREVQPR